MTQSSTSSTIQLRSFASAPSLFTDVRAALNAGCIVAALFAATTGVHAQTTDPAPAPAAQTSPDSAAPATAPDTTQPGLAISNQKPTKTRKKDDKVVQSKDTKKEVKQIKKDNALEGIDAKLPDKQLYDKAEDAMKHGRYDVARLDLQTLLNTYQDSQFMMHAKLAIADSWFKEGGLAALTQAEQEYKDFITFFPNAPEAAEAQMRVGDIYFRQMDKPDRDYSKTVHAEEEYRLMLQQFPESALVPQANQRLREVQETLAGREADIATFYATRTPPNYPGAIARYQTVVDTYPLYSHMDDVLIGLADSYGAEAAIVRTMRLPEAAKAQLERIYDDQQYAALSQVILEHSAAPHVEDARDRIVGMGRPVPTPTPEQVAASAALENSRGQYTLSKRAIGFFLHQADTVPAATLGAPPLEDAKPTVAPMVVRKAINDFNAAMSPAANGAQPANSLLPSSAPSDATQAPSPAPADAPLSLQDVPTAAGVQSSRSSSVTSVPQAAPAISPGNSLGVEIIQPPAGSSQAPITPPTEAPAFPGTPAPDSAAPATTTPNNNGGLTAVGPANATPLAPIEKAAPAPATINEATGATQPPAQAAPANGKKPKPALDKSQESSSKKKPKKGLDKLNPF